mgnify:CR=1 FL=1
MRIQKESARGLDKIDRKILRILQEDARIAMKDLSEQVGLSITPTIERVKRMERDGVIAGYHARLNPRALGASLLVFVLAWNEVLTRADGVMLLTALAIYLGLLLRQSRHSGRPVSSHDHHAQAPWLSSLLMIVAGLAMLVYAGHLLLGAAVAVATDLGLSERIIGLTIVAVSTSLPELATSLIAAATPASLATSTCQ